MTRGYSGLRMGGFSRLYEPRNDRCPAGSRNDTKPVAVKSRRGKKDKEKEHFRRERTFSYATKESAPSTQYFEAYMRSAR